MFGEQPLWMIETTEDLAKMCEKLSRATSIGVDTESDSFYSYQERVCLIQISDADTDFIVDPLAFDDLSPLAPIFADPRIVKIFHGADYDIVCMKRDFGFAFHGVFDTMISAQLLAFPKVGLADLIHRFFGHEIDKKYQRHDWSKRPLLPEHIEYARGDSHFLPALREILTRRLEAASRLHHLEEECKLLEEREWSQRPFDEDGYLRMKTTTGLDDDALRVLKFLYLYRDGEARSMNRPVFKVISDRDLVALAKARPTSRKALDAALPGKHGLKRRHATALLEKIAEGLEADFEVPTLSKKRSRSKPEPEGPPTRLNGQRAETTLNALKDWRNRVCKADALNPVAVIPNAILKNVARCRPMSLDELREIPDMRTWQIEEYGTSLLEVLDEVVPLPLDPDGSDAPAKKRRRRRKSKSKED